MENPHHRELLQLILENSGTGNTQTDKNSYLGNANPRYKITAPVLRRIAKDWMRTNKALTSEQIESLLTSLITAESSTEKQFAGILLGYTTREQREFSPAIFDRWLDYLSGWAEIDAVCTGDYTITHIPLKWKAWKPLLNKFSRDTNISKRRASLVLLTSVIRYNKDESMAETAIKIIERLKGEKEILITKAVSWLLRSMIRNHKKLVSDYLGRNKDSLPKVAVRETLMKLKTGTKTSRQRV
jgi:3-methyladenine DNA glycosylase AlkD